MCCPSLYLSLSLPLAISISLCFSLFLSFSLSLSRSLSLPVTHRLRSAALTVIFAKKGKGPTQENPMAM